MKHAHEAAHREGEREDEGGHRGGRLPAALLGDHEDVRDAGDEERDRHHRDDELHACRAPPLRDMSNSRVAAKSRRRKPIRNAAEASFGRPSTPVTSGSPARIDRRRAGSAGRAGTARACRPGRAAAPPSGTTRRAPRSSTARSRAAGSRIGGSSTTKSPRSPGSTRAASQPTAIITRRERGEPDRRRPRTAPPPASRGSRRAGPSTARRARAAASRARAPSRRAGCAS